MNSQPEPLDHCWLQLYNGKAFYPKNPHMSMDAIDIETIGTVLSRIPRFGGHTNEFYSVAEHSVRVSWLLPDELKLAGLLHDAHEAFSGYGDVASPVKWDAPDLKEIESKIDDAIAYVFGFDVTLFSNPLIKLADLRMLATEARDLLKEPPFTWGILPEPLETKIIPTYSIDACNAFIITAGTLGACKPSTSLIERIK